MAELRMTDIEVARNFAAVLEKVKQGSKRPSKATANPWTRLRGIDPSSWHTAATNNQII